MCRTIQPPGIFFMPSTATLEEFQFLPPPVPLPLCPSYMTKKTDVDLPAPLPPSQVLRRGLEFVLSAEGVRFTDLAFVGEVKARIAELMSTASTSEASNNNNSRLAKKTLKFRNIAQQEQSGEVAVSAL
ncbi:hypothetical protein F442_01586 [Phytophthora nicotianae P10297]|uniref:Uncharacterized protein n=3 Tax=Phytophthora nicotianae TaxID=4792 RepID=W3A2X4_PHYNI|nr:hypothetical protein L915_01561 [Phytophthora nicotianae]ETM01964.1 hypothetical protein L917_01512 [Phytophthora nicotianae]ETM55213.1 hypothetical protein L914_01552 [Phytophthora nicotianae]ETO84454.1 hypothetical protein F444_01644 [Phytophthora nicotianae P1976]ETP53531.1 hypothetical protein F442_01586 [Phytophthora nicotianae P10297]